MTLRSPPPIATVIFMALLRITGAPGRLSKGLWKCGGDALRAAIDWRWSFWTWAQSTSKTPAIRPISNSASGMVMVPCCLLIRVMMLEERVVIDASRVVDIPLISCDSSFTAAVRAAVDRLSSALFLLIDASSLLRSPRRAFIWAFLTPSSLLGSNTSSLVTTRPSCWFSEVWPFATLITEAATAEGRSSRSCTRRETSTSPPAAPPSELCWLFKLGRFLGTVLVEGLGSFSLRLPFVSPWFPPGGFLCVGLVVVGVADLLCSWGSQTHCLSHPE